MSEEFPKTFRIAVINISKDKEKEVIEGLIDMAKKGLFSINDIHTRDD